MNAGPPDSEDLTGPNIEAIQPVGYGEQVGDMLGPYRLLEIIGEGGFGVVWLAERREPMVQRVALKIIKPGMDSKAVIARFEQERQALAAMDHPNVAKVFDGGVSPGGRPFFVMEHVKGEAITTYADRHRLTIRQRLELFIPVCEAVQHAHQKGLIHRDLKPTNILVAVAHGQPSPKVIDFGVAKAITHTLTDKTIFTQTGQLIGTPEYMSPEQAEMGATDIDTRSDVYSLGVVLYELLSGLLPFSADELRFAGYDAIRKILREKEPLRPSTRLSSVEDAAGRTIAERRQDARDGLAKLLRSELDWIPMRCMAKDRALRYDSPSSLGKDIQRYLEGLPLEAGPETALYRASKFLKRHRLSTTVVGVIVAALSVASVAMWWSWTLDRELLLVRAREAESARRAEQEQRRLAEAEADARAQVLRESYAANLAAADLSLAAGEYGLARARLEACPEDLQNWEWRYLDRCSDNSRMAIRAHEEGARVAVFDHAGSRIVTGSEGGVVSIWDANSGRLIFSAPIHAQTVYFIGMSQDGTRFVTASEDGTAKICDAQSGEPRIILSGHDSGVFTARFDPSGTKVLTTSRDGTVRLWDAGTGRYERTLLEEPEPVRDAAFSPSGDRIAVALRRGAVRLLDVSSSAEIARSQDESLNVWRLSYDPSGERIACATGSMGVRILDATSLKDVADLARARGNIWDVAFSKDGRSIAIASLDGTVSVLDAHSWEHAAQLAGPRDSAHSVGFAPDGQAVVAASADGNVYVWPARPDPNPRIITAHDEFIVAACASPDGKFFVTTSVDATGRVRRFADAEAATVLRGHSHSIQGVAVSPDSARIATASWDGTTRIWDASSGRGLAVLDTGPALSVAFGNEEAVAVASGSSIQVWDAQSRTRVRTIDPEMGEVRYLSFHAPTGMWTAAGTSGDARVWDRNWELRESLRDPDGWLNCAVLDPAGKRLVTTSNSGKVVLWDISTGAPAHVLRESGPSLNIAAFSRDGSRVAAGSWDRSARIWDTTSGTEVFALRGHELAVIAAGFDATDSLLATFGLDGTVRIWNGSPR